MSDKLKVIITGATGMVGEGVLNECLKSEQVEKILVIGRKACGYKHEKLSERLIPDFFNLGQPGDEIKEYNTCFFCMGVSSVGMSEADYTRLTYELTLNFARWLKEANPRVSFAYISGSGTDSSEKGRSMWARVKGKTENELLAMFENAWMFRPGYMQPTPGLKNTLRYYTYIKWMYPFFRLVFPGFVSTLSELGKAMIACAASRVPIRLLSVKDIVHFAKN